MKRKHTKLFSFVVSISALVVLFTAGVSVAEAKRGATVPPKKCKYTQYCKYIVTKDNIAYDITGSATYTRTCGKNTFPSWGCEFLKNEIIERIGPASLSQQWNLSCGNTHRYNATILDGIDGMCGPAAGRTFSSFPTTQRCMIGTVTNKQTFTDKYKWICDGPYGGGDVVCEANRKTDIGLTCTPSIATPKVGETVTFTANVTGTSTPESAFAFTWNVNGTDFADDKTFSRVFNSATNTAEVSVIAKKGNLTLEEQCDFDRVDCNNNQFYCGDVDPTTSYSCVPTATDCPNSYCGTSGGSQIYAISQDKQLASGGGLSRTIPTADYISSNLLCAPGSLLAENGGISSWNFTAGYSTWTWECKHPNAEVSAACKARCKTGEYYCLSKNKCIPDAENCDCSLDPTGDIVNQKEYCVNANGSCYSCGKVIDFFSLKPDEVPKDQTAKLCGGYWETNTIADTQKPEGTVDTRVVCTMQSGSTTVSVPANNPLNSIPYSLGIGAHTLTCTQQYQLGTGPEWIDLQSSTLDARCRGLPAVIEQ